MFIYPDDVPPSDRALIEERVRQADDAWYATLLPNLVVVRMQDGFNGAGEAGMVYTAASDPAAVDGILGVAETIVRTLARRVMRGQISDKRFEEIVDELMEQRIVWVYLHQHSKTHQSRPLMIDEFRDLVHARLPTTVRAEERHPVALDTASAEPASELKTSRAQLLADFKRATGVTKNRPIYECRKSGIHKPQFYQWLNGELSATSETAINFERFLREQRLPASTD